MPSELPLASIVVAIVATYLLHSTVFLGGAWLLLVVSRIQSAAFQERVWKVAAMAPLLTAPLQFAGAERFNATAVWTLPAISFDRLQAAVQMPPAVAKPQADAEIEIVAAEPVDSGAAEIQAALDEDALAEIVPDSGPPLEFASDPLPTIEPATDASVFIPVTIEPAPIDIPAAEVDTNPVRADATVRPVDVEPVLDAASTPIAFRPETDSFGGWRDGVSLGLTAVTLLGSFSLMWRVAAGRWRLRSTETINEGALRSSLDRLLKERGVRRPLRLACSATASEPSAGGILHWVIVVPRDLESRLSPAEQYALLAHELAHLVRRDPLWLWIGTALCWCLPFQPLNFLAVRRWRQPAEELCDDWAVAGGVKPLTLANCLTRVAEWRLAPMPVGLTADIGKSRFARRISRLVDHEASRDHWLRPARQRLLFAGALTCSLVLTVCGPRMQAASSPSGEPGGVSPRINPNDPLPTAPAHGVAGAGLSAAKEAPVDEAEGPAAPTVDVQDELAALLFDLERLDALIGDSADDPELESARSGLRSRIDAIKTRITTSK